MYRKYVCLSVVLLLALTGGALGEVPGWWSLDIGTTGGSATEQNGTITITADGAGIWGTSDEFYYVYKQLSGDGHIAARFIDFGPGSNGWATAGVMIRETLEPNSPHAMMALTGGEGGGTTFGWRSSLGAENEFVDGPSPPIELPVYLSMVLQEEVVSAWTRPPAWDWMLFAKAHVPMTEPVSIGLFAAGSPGAREVHTGVDEVQLSGHVEGTLHDTPCEKVNRIVDSLRLYPLPPPIMLPNGGCTLHSDGQQCEFPGLSEDICMVQPLWLDISPPATEQIFNEVLPPGDGPVGFTVYASPGPPPPGPHVLIINQFKGVIPLNDPIHSYQYAVVFDADGQTSNNYVPWPDYPNDSFGGTDKWYEVTYCPDSGWGFWVTDVRQDFAEVQSNAWVTIADSPTGSTMGWFIPRQELDTDTPTFRATAFAHTGDWGMFDPWSMDYYPLVGDSLLPVTGPVYTPLSDPPEIQNIQFEQVNWYGPDGNLVEENSLWGRMLYEYQPVDQTWYLNVNLADSSGGTGSWVVQNLPLFAVDNDDYSMRNEAVDINLRELGMEVGQDWSQAYCTWLLTDWIRTEPPTGPESFFDVVDSDRFAWCPIGESPDPAPFIGAGTPVGVKLDQPAVKESKSRDVNAVQEGDNKCCAGSFARSIDWLNRAHGLGIGKGAQGIYDDLIAAGVSKPNADGSVARDEWIAAKNTYARQKTNNKIVTKVWDPGDMGYEGFPNGMVDPIEGVTETNGDFATWLKNELKHGEDVELAYFYSGGAHIVTVLKVYTSGGDTYVKYRDDEKQGPGPNKTKGDTHVKHSKVYKKDGKWHFGSDANTIYFAVSESPDKNQNGIGDGFDAGAKQS